MRFKLGDYIVDTDGTFVRVECVGKNHNWDPTNTYLCPWCEEAAGRIAEQIPQRMDWCLPCGRRLEKGEHHYFKQGVPGSTECLDCGKKAGLDKYKHWLITECRPYHLWTDAEVSRGKPIGEFSPPDCKNFCCDPEGAAKRYREANPQKFCHETVRFDGGPIYCYQTIPCRIHGASKAQQQDIKKS